MNTPNKIEDYIFQGDFNAAKQCLRDGEKFSERYLKNNFSQIAGRIIETKEIDLIDALIQAGFIETDLYELESFDASIFSPVASYLKNDDASISFFKELMSKMKNVNDEVSDQTLLGYCLKEGADVKIIQILIEDYGCNCQYKNNAEENFIFTVINNYNIVPEKGKGYIQLLLENGVDVNEKNSVGETALIRAVIKCKEDYISLLIENGAEANETDSRNNTAFYYAVAEQRSYEMYKILADALAADFNIINKNGGTLLTQFISQMSDSEQDIVFFERLLADGADLTFCAQYYSRPKSGLEYAIERNSGILKCILNNGAVDVNDQDNAGNTLLHKVCAYNINFDREAAKETYRKVKLLLEHGADKNISNDQDQTALMLASRDNLKVKAVEVLMQY